MNSGKQSLGRSGLQVSRLGLGAMTWGDHRQVPWWNPAKAAYGSAHGIEEERRALEASLAAGVNFIDTAAMYGAGASERRLGEIGQHKDLVIATKFPGTWFTRTGSLPDVLDASLARLKRNTVDLYQIHFHIPWMSIPKLMHLLADAVEAGKVRAVGVSNYSAKQMRIAHAELAKRGIPLASNQVEYSLLNRDPEVNGVLETCQELGITLIALSPLAMGALTGKYTATNKATGMRRFTSHFRPQGIAAIQPVVELLHEIGGRYDRSPSQVALRWLIENDHVLPIPGAKNEKQAASNAGALSFRLTADEIDALNRVTLRWGAESAPSHA